MDQLLDRHISLLEREFKACKGTSGVIQIFFDDNGEIFLPDRTLNQIFQVNGSTLRGRLNRMKKRLNGRYLLTDKAFPQTKVPVVHGTVALNSIRLVNFALVDWIIPNLHRLLTSLHEIEVNLLRAALPFHRTEHGL